MRITFIMTNASMSGGTRVIAIHARELMARGHEVLVISTPPRRPGLRRTVSSLIKGNGWPKIWKVGESFLDGTGVPHKILPEFRPVNDRDVPDGDAVIATWWETADWINRLSPAKGAKSYFIQHYETWGGDPTGVDRTWRLPIHKIVISHWLKELAAEKFGDHSVSHVPNSVDMQQFNAPARDKNAKPTVGMLYNPQWFKGCDVSLKAFEIARQSMPNLQMIAFGEKPPIDRLPLPAGARYIQKPGQDQIKDIYAACDVWLCGSRGEGFHLPPLEAMACRCPVVSTRVGGPMDTVRDGINGYLAPVEDHAALAARLVEVLAQSADNWRKMSAAAYATACGYTWQDAAALMEAALIEAKKLQAESPRDAARSSQINNPVRQSISA